MTVLCRLVIGLGLIGAVAGCKTFSDRTEKFRDLYGTGRFAEAEEELDRLLGKENKIKPAAVGLAVDTVDVTGKNTCVFLMEKAMVRLAQGDPRTAITLLRIVRDELDNRLVHDAGRYFQRLAASVTDDRALEYPGADYEHVVIRVMLALCDLLVGGEDAFAYAEQVGEKQEEIIDSEFGTVEGSTGYKPRENYRRVAVGAYLQGLIREHNLAPDEACRAYERALGYAPGNPLLAEATERACRGNYVSQGNGVLHVFYLAGRGPHLTQTRSEITELALRLAGIMMTILGNDPSVLAQASIPVPQVTVNGPPPPPLRVSSDAVNATSTAILDVNQVATEQLEANMPWIIARAVVRRAIKAGAGVAVREGVRHAAGSRGWGILAGLLFNLFSTSFEVADTRNWSSLPAQIQALRLELAAGPHVVHFSSGGTETVRIVAGRDSYVVVVQPALASPGVILVDEFSRVAPLEAVP